MSYYTWTVQKSATGIPIVVCRDASGAEVSRWSDSKVGVVVRNPSRGGPPWVRPRCPVPAIVTKLLAEAA